MLLATEIQLRMYKTQHVQYIVQGLAANRFISSQAARKASSLMTTDTVETWLLKATKHQSKVSFLMKDPYTITDNTVQ
jgi:hypothetical protein